MGAMGRAPHSREQHASLRSGTPSRRGPRRQTRVVIWLVLFGLLPLADNSTVPQCAPSEVRPQSTALSMRANSRNVECIRHLVFASWSIKSNSRVCFGAPLSEEVLKRNREVLSFANLRASARASERCVCKMKRKLARAFQLIEAHMGNEQNEKVCLIAAFHTCRS